MPTHRICIVTHLYPRDEKDYKGSFVSDMAVALLRRGHDVHVVTPMRPGAKKTEVTGGIHVHRFAYWKWRDGKQLGQLKGTPVLLLGSFIISGVIKSMITVLKYNIRLIHAYWVVPGGLIGVVCGLLTNRPVVATAAGTDLNIAPRNRIIRLFIRLTLKAINRVIAVSSAMKHHAESLGLSIEKGHVIPGPAGIDSQYFNPRRNERVKKAASEKQLLYVGNLTAPKRVDTILHAMQTVCKTIQNAQLIIAGDGDLRESLEALTDSLDIRQHVRFLGAVPHDDVTILMQQSDIFVHCSENEGLPVAIMEALASGLPVVASSVGGVPDLIRDGETGYLLAPGDFEGYADRIILLLQNDDQRKQMEKNSRIFAQNRLTQDRVLSGLEDVYESLLNPDLYHDNLCRYLSK